MKEATIVAIFTGKDMPSVYEAARILDKADVNYEKLLRPQSPVKVPLTGHYLKDEDAWYLVVAKDDLCKAANLINRHPSMKQFLHPVTKTCVTSISTETAQAMNTVMTDRLAHGGP